VRNAFTLGRQDYHWRHEPCLAGWKDLGSPHTWLGGRDQPIVLEFDKPVRNADHPTMKPVALFQRLVENSLPGWSRSTPLPRHHRPPLGGPHRHPGRA